MFPIRKSHFFPIRRSRKSEKYYFFANPDGSQFGEVLFFANSEGLFFATPEGSCFANSERQNPAPNENQAGHGTKGDCIRRITCEPTPVEQGHDFTTSNVTLDRENFGFF